MKASLLSLALFLVFWSCQMEEPIPTYTLSSTVSPAEGGKITISPQAPNYPEGSQVTLTPEPNENWVFKQWEGDATGNTTPLQLTMTANKTITGVFVKRDYPLNIKIEGEGTVEEKIVPNPSGREYPHGTTVELTPKPKEGWEFAGWDGDLTGKESPKRIIVDKQKNVTVKFSEALFKVNPNARSLGREYWENIQYPKDLYITVFQNRSIENNPSIHTFPSAWGDFNLDGYLDILNTGSSFARFPSANATFLLWNNESKIFEEKNLFNDKAIKIIGGNTNRIIPRYFNDDDYIDFLTFDGGDEGVVYTTYPPEPIRIILSDGKGGYDVKDIETAEGDEFFKIMKHGIWGGDMGDLNGDGIEDLFVACNSITYIFWGIRQFPYFTKTERIFFASDYTNPIFNNIKGLSTCYKCADQIFDAKIIDIDKDGDNDILTIGRDKNGFDYQRVMVNKHNNGVFTNADVVNLPINHQSDVGYVMDLIITDLDNNGKLDVIYVYINSKTEYLVRVYLQKEFMNFVLDESWTNYTANWAFTLTYFDMNKDGKKDIIIKEGHSENNEKTDKIYNKKVLLRIGNKFETKDFYQFDDFAKKIRDSYFKQ